MGEIGLPWQKDFSPVSFTAASGATFIENFFLLMLIAVHPLTLSSLPFFVTASQHSFDRYDPVITGDLDNSCKKTDPLQKVLLSQYPGPDDLVPFPGNYLS